jgi:uncharacterized membrane protein YfcA
MIAGFIAGFVNTLAGGGSIFTLPVLMLIGMPADIANGTNRVAVLMQSIAAVKGFKRHGQLDQTALLPIIVPTVFGALIGALIASYLPVGLLKPLLIGTMIVMTLLILLQPNLIPAPGGTARDVRQNPRARIGLFLAGLYGGFVQAGVGFILLAVLAGTLRYDLLRANALKMLCTAVFSVVALAVFISRDQVSWIPGIVMGLATIGGVQISVRFAISAQHTTLRWIVLAMAIVVCIAALFSG